MSLTLDTRGVSGRGRRWNRTIHCLLRRLFFTPILSFNRLTQYRFHGHDFSVRAFRCFHLILQALSSTWPILRREPGARYTCCIRCFRCVSRADCHHAISQFS